MVECVKIVYLGTTTQKQRVFSETIYIFFMLGTKRKVVAVDLTLSDSDDDEASKPPPSKRPATSSSNPTSSSHPTHNQTPPTNHHVASQQQPQQQQLQQQPTQSGSSRSHPYPVTGPTPVALTANQSHYLPGSNRTTRLIEIKSIPVKNKFETNNDASWKKKGDDEEESMRKDRGIVRLIATLLSARFTA